MNSQSTVRSLTNVSTDSSQATGLQRWIRYFLCAGFGLIGGTAGVAVAIGLVIFIQLLLVPTAFFPGIIELTGAAVLAGLGVSWLISRAARRILPELFGQPDERGIQIVMFFSVLTGLLQTFLFAYNI